MTSDTDPYSLNQVVGRIATHLAADDYPSGDLAQLRRLSANAPNGMAFWHLLVAFAPAALDDERLRRALAIVVRGMALTRPFHRPLHGRRSLGLALAEAEVAEMRFLRLLRANADRLDAELRQIAMLVQSRPDEARFDWSGPLQLILTAGQDGNKIRQSLSFDYYRRLLQLNKE